jgi:AcrR family transcriptional regulator
MTTSQATMSVHQTDAIPSEHTELDGRARILRAAHERFVTYGYKSVSMQQIADAAQIQKATLYHHFRSKDDLFAAVVHAIFEHINAEVAEVIERGGSAADQFVQIACQSFARSESDFGRLMTDVQENLGVEQRNTLLKERAFPWNLFETIFKQAVRDGELPDIDPALAITMYVGMVWGPLWMRKIGRHDYPLNEALARTIVDTLFAGLRETAPDTLRLETDGQFLD